MRMKRNSILFGHFIASSETSRPAATLVALAVSLIVLRQVPSTVALFVGGGGKCLVVQRGFKALNNLSISKVSRHGYSSNALQNMLIRVRTNRGLWRVPQLDDEKATAQDVLKHIYETHPRISLTKPLSLDPGCKSPLNLSQTLKEHRLIHGSMIYCRVEDKNDTQQSAQDISNNKANKDSEKRSSNYASDIANMPSMLSLSIFGM